MVICINMKHFKGGLIFCFCFNEPSDHLVASLLRVLLQNQYGRDVQDIGHLARVGRQENNIKS